MTDEEMLAFAARFATALEGSDAEAVRKFYAPDAKIWHNYDQIEQTVDQNLKVLAWFIKSTTNRRYRITRRVAIPGGFLQQHVLECVLPDKTEFDMPAIAVVLVSDGRITRIEEYLDSAKSAVLRKFGR